mgnify:CR=1 FL=1
MNMYLHVWILKSKILIFQAVQSAQKSGITIYLQVSLE